MKVKTLAVLCLVLLASCAPHINFNIEVPDGQAKKLFIRGVRDNRPYNEKLGYKVFFIKSIADTDYKIGFTEEFRAGLTRGLGKEVELVGAAEDADLILDVKVNHFYGEFARTVKTVVYEYLSWILLGIPRLFTDFIPYNDFAGRAAMDLTFTRRDGSSFTRSFDLKFNDTANTYHRSSAFTAARLCKAASPEISRIVSDAER
jgi:hypothetical protein